MQNDVLARAVDRPTAARRAAAAEDVRRLIDAGLAVMRRQGTIDPKVSDIVREAGLSNQAFYRHFEGKNELLLAIMADGRRTLVAFLTSRMAQAATPVEAIRHWVEGILAQARNARAAGATRPFAVNAGRLTHQYPGDVAAAAAALKAPLLDALRAAGVTDPDRDADAAYTLAVATMERHLIAGTRPSGADVDHVARFVLRGVSP